MGKPMGIRRFVAGAGHVIMYDGLGALAFAVVQLLWLRGLDIRIFLLFGAPPFLAVMILRRGETAAGRRLAAAFLIAIGVGGIVAHVPALFPKLHAGFPGLAQAQDRLLSWYTAIYCLFFTTVCPLVLFTRDLRAHRRGEKATFSRFTCILGLFAASLMLIGWPGVLGILGFWPIL